MPQTARGMGSGFRPRALRPPRTLLIKGCTPDPSFRAQCLHHRCLTLSPSPARAELLGVPGGDQMPKSNLNCSILSLSLKSLLLNLDVIYEKNGMTHVNPLGVSNKKILHTPCFYSFAISRTFSFFLPA